MAKRKATAAPARAWQTRIVGQGEEKPDQLLANPRNWRIHSEAQQQGVTALLERVGWVQQVIVNKTTGHVVDGHLRVSLALRREEPVVPVLYVELTDEEEALVLASLDPLAGLAGTDSEQLRALLDELAGAPHGEAVDQLLTMISRTAGIIGEQTVDPFAEWDGMPEFDQEDKTAYQTIRVHFKGEADARAFAQLVGQAVTEKTRSIWYPAAEIETYADKRYAVIAEDAEA